MNSVLPAMRNPASIARFLPSNGMNCVRRACVLVLLMLPVLAATANAADLPQPTTEQIEFFEKKIRPLLVTHCFECHGNGRTKGGLNLASSAGMLEGGESGPAVVLNQPESSLLLAAVRHTGD